MIDKKTRVKKEAKNAQPGSFKNACKQSMHKNIILLACSIMFALFSFVTKKYVDVEITIEFYSPLPHKTAFTVVCPSFCLSIYHSTISKWLFQKGSLSLISLTKLETQSEDCFQLLPRVLVLGLVYRAILSRFYTPELLVYNFSSPVYRVLLLLSDRENSTNCTITNLIVLLIINRSKWTIKLKFIEFKHKLDRAY